MYKELNVRAGACKHVTSNSHKVDAEKNTTSNGFRDKIHKSTRK